MSHKEVMEHVPMSISKSRAVAKCNSTDLLTV